DPNHEERPEYFELYNLGFGDPFPTAAEHARGTHELLAAIAERLPDGGEGAEEEAVRVAIIGRPNVGKSSLLNAIVGDERVIVADELGTTRAPGGFTSTFAARPFVLIDTAGIRSKDDGDMEYYARLRSESALRRCDVGILVIDPFEVGDHELRLANL